MNNKYNSVPLVQREDFLPNYVLQDYDSIYHAREFKGARDLKSPKINRELSKKLITIFAATSIVVGATVGISALQQKSYEDASAVVQTISVPREYTHGRDIDLVFQKNGEVFYQLEDGKLTSSFENVSSNDMAARLGYTTMANQSSLNR